MWDCDRVFAGNISLKRKGVLFVAYERKIFPFSSFCRIMKPGRKWIMQEVDMKDDSVKETKKQQKIKYQGLKMKLVEFQNGKK